MNKWNIDSKWAERCGKASSEWIIKHPDFTDKELNALHDGMQIMFELYKKYENKD
jgi:hypothetical protein